MSEIFRLMGLISYSEKVESQNFVKERSLLNDMWVLLNGGQTGNVSYRNLLLFIFAIMGLEIDLPTFKKGNENQMNICLSKDMAQPLLRDIAEMKVEQIEQFKQLTEKNLNISRASYMQQQQQQYFTSEQTEEKNFPVERFQSKNENLNENMKNWLNQRKAILNVGNFDENNNLILTSQEIKIIQESFYPFYNNKLHTDREKQNYFSTSPSKNNHLQSQEPNKQNLFERIKHVEHLLAQNNEKKQIQEQQKAQQEELKLFECTFAPQINNYNSSQQQENIDKNNPKRFLELYSLAKPRSQLKDKNTSEVEYEKFCDECTFSPDIRKSKLNQYNLSKEVYIRNKDETVERLRKAFQDSQQVKQYVQRGELIFTGSRSPDNQRRKQNKIGSSQLNSPSLKLKRPYTGSSKYDIGTQNLRKNNASSQLQQQDLEEHELKQMAYEQFMQNKQQYVEGENQQQNNEAENERSPLLFVDINLGENQIERIVIYKDDQPEELANNFIKQHGLDINLKERLTQLLIMQIQNSLNNNE